MPTTLPSDWLAAPGEWLVAAVAAPVLMGGVMLLWGRVLHRALLALIAAGAGLLLAGQFAPRVSLSPFVAQLAAAITLGVLALVLARLVWAVLAGAHVAAVTGAVVAVWYLDVQLATTQPAAQPDVIAGGRALAEELVRAVWAQHAMAMSTTIILAGLAGLIVAFVLPRATVICMTSLIGASLVSVGAGLAVMVWQPGLLTAPSPSSGYVAGGIGGGLLLVGILFQSVGEVRARRGKRGGGDESEGREGKPPGRGRGKGE